MMKKIFGGDAVLGLPGDTKAEDYVSTVQERLRYIRGYTNARAEVITAKQKAFPKTEFSGEAALKIGTTVLVEYKDKFAVIKLKQEISWKFDASKTKEFNRDKKGRVMPGDTAESKKGTEKCYIINPTSMTELLEDPKVAMAVGGRPLATLVYAMTSESLPPLLAGLLGGELIFYCKPTVDAKFWATDAEIQDNLNVKVEGHQTPEAISTFMSPEHNPVVKAFEGTRGRGLAGFITQMSLNYDKAQWGTMEAKDDRLRAPKLVEVSLNFAPVHDLPLGLDYSGEMFAPSHPVGPMSSTALNDASYTPDPSPDMYYTANEAFIVTQAEQQPLDESKLKDPTKAELPF